MLQTAQIRMLSRVMDEFSSYAILTCLKIYRFSFIHNLFHFSFIPLGPGRVQTSSSQKYAFSYLLGCSLLIMLHDHTEKLAEMIYPFY